MWPWGSPTQNEPPRIPRKGSEQDKGKPGDGVLEAREGEGFEEEGVAERQTPVTLGLAT